MAIIAIACYRKHATSSTTASKRSRSSSSAASPSGATTTQQSKTCEEGGTYMTTFTSLIGCRTGSLPRYTLCMSYCMFFWFTIFKILTILDSTSSGVTASSTVLPVNDHRLALAVRNFLHVGLCLFQSAASQARPQ